jgi:aromatic ring-opening dioxygenase LigB subunit
MSHRVNAQSPYGMVRGGAEFDARIAESIGKSEPELMLSIDADLRERAAECGYNSIIMLAGALGIDRNTDGSGASNGRIPAGSSLYSYEAPFGIGYCVAEFTPGYEKER